MGNSCFLKLKETTKHLVVHTHELLKQAMLSMEVRTEIATKVYDAIEKVKGSGWSIYGFDKLCSIAHSLKVPRTGSYIKTPEHTVILNVD